MRRCLWSLIALALCAGCKTAHSTTPAAPVTAASSGSLSANAGLPLPPGLDATAMNSAASPCDDFYEFACGGWLKSNEIPADKSSWSRGFTAIAETNEKTLHAILETVASGTSTLKTPYASTLGDLYAGCMDVAQAERSLKEAKRELATLLHTQTPKALANSLARLHARGVDGFFTFESTQDARDATLEIGEVDQGGLGLPDREYYLSDTPDKKSIRDAYQKHVQAQLLLWGESPKKATADAATVMVVETRLAKASLDKVARRDPEKVYHRLERVGLKATAPAFPWDVYFKEAGTPDFKPLNVTHPPFFSEFASVIQTIPAKSLETYLTWHYVESRTLALPKAFAEESFRFNAKALTGAKEDRPRWKKCVALSDGMMGEALAVPFVEQTFGQNGKVKALEVVNAIEASFEKDLGTLEWMDSPTKAKAVEKVRKIINKIGFPDSWRSYDGLVASRAHFLTSLGNASAFEQKRVLSKIGKPVNRKEWLMSPPTVNAYYNPPLNEVVFPAGILQPPFFNKEATYPVNFGAMGMVVGHEFTHGFDDEGSQFDGDGNLRNWWTEGSAKAFKQRTQCVKTQFDDYVAIDDIHLNGGLTLGENVADLGGLKLAHSAMEDWVKAHPSSSGTGYRYNNEQQFFLGFAQSWCQKTRPERMRMLASVDPHSPPSLRVAGPLGNLASFRNAFACPAGSKISRPAAKECKVW